MLERYTVIIEKVSYKNCTRPRKHSRTEEPKGTKTTPSGGTPLVTESTSNKLESRTKDQGRYLVT